MCGLKMAVLMNRLIHAIMSTLIMLFWAAVTCAIVFSAIALFVAFPVWGLIILVVIMTVFNWFDPPQQRYYDDWWDDEETSTTNEKEDVK